MPFTPSLTCSAFEVMRPLTAADLSTYHATRLADWTDADFMRVIIHTGRTGGAGASRSRRPDPAPLPRTVEEDFY